jgi:pimeloyl-ACP methyl ester carboxylesterase
MGMEGRLVASATWKLREFIRRNHRGNLYAGGARFSWSGAYRRTDREQAAVDLCDWARDIAPGVQTAFAHSYGGEVAARAVLRGAHVSELVLLSAPATSAVSAVAGSGLPVVDVRLRFDPVLALARTRQRLSAGPNVTEVLLNQWRLGHSASHEESVWLTEAVAERGEI